MLKHRSITIDRFNTFLSDTFGDVNINAVLYSKKNSNCVRLNAFKVPDLKRIPFNEAIKNNFQPAKVGEKFGPSWATIWFHVDIVIPEDWKDEIIYFLWNCNNEGLIWSKDGRPLQGLTGGNGNDERHEYILNSKDIKDNHTEFYIEVACNGMFGNGGNGMINAPNPNRYFTLDEAEIAIPNIEVWNLLYDFQVIASMAKNLPENSARGSQALYFSNKIINVFDVEDKSTWKKAREIASEFLNKKSGDYVHQVHAIGNCHIDTAWLWPYDETKRKCARSWASQIRLMEKYPDYTFVASQAQQFEWTKELYPSLFSEIQEKVKEGQFIPIGNTWVEMDCNIPSGESFIRQFLYGHKFYMNNFNYSSDVFWLPDTFGYSAQLPQIINYMGMKYFFTQKLSWNNINKFPHTSFYWIGLDGSKVLTHFSPANTYTASATVNEVINCEKNNKDVAFSNDSLLVYGVGDGGGGPLMSMIERLERMKNVEGIPNVKMSDPTKFFEVLEKTSYDLPKWKGELYFELHRGTYTSQAKNKMYNRLTEYLLRDVEVLSCMAMVLKPEYNYPQDELEVLWKDILLNQFHDVLPGSSIGMVYTDSIKIYENVMEKGNKLKNNSINSIIFNSSEHVDGENGYVIFNTTQWERSEIIEIPLLPKQKNTIQLSNNSNNSLIYVENVPSVGYKIVNETNEINKQVSVMFDNSTNTYKMKNDYLSVVFDSKGRMISLIDNHINRELIRPKEKGNVFLIYEDIPLYWDAWDVEIYHLEKGKEVEAGNVKIIETGPLRVALEIKHELSKTSTLIQRVYLTAVSKRIDFETEVDWNENHKFLKVEFPFDISSDTATYETAFGNVKRPTHYNTSWDYAKFEVCGHKYADLSEYGYGVALLNDSKYGYAVHDNVMRLSLLRSPKAPDDNCDIGHHQFKYAIYPHEGSIYEADVVQEGYNFNVPLIPRYIEDMKMKNSIHSMLSVDKSRNVIIDTVKRVESPIGYEAIDYPNKNEGQVIIVRLYEALGGKTQFTLKSCLPIKKCWICNGLEQYIENVNWVDSSCTLTINPFQILTLKLFYEVNQIINK